MSYGPKVLLLHALGHLMPMRAAALGIRRRLYGNRHGLRIMCLHRTQAQQIEQILMNLINNSGHALEDRNNAKIHIESRLTDKHISITVSDNGPGIPQVNLEEIWKPFFTTKPSGVGTGIGLSICRKSSKPMAAL